MGDYWRDPLWGDPGKSSKSRSSLTRRGMVVAGSAQAVPESYYYCRLQPAYKRTNET
jgi:hypothetical protein